jgi:hypothetical protein
MEIVTMLCAAPQDLVDFVENKSRFYTGRCEADLIVLRLKFNTVFRLRRSYRRSVAYNTSDINVNTT